LHCEGENRDQTAKRQLNVIHRLIDFPRINDAPGVRALSRHRDTPQLHPLSCQAFEPIVLLVKIWKLLTLYLPTEI
jgi:hypothetical protein